MFLGSGLKKSLADFPRYTLLHSYTYYANNGVNIFIFFQ